MTNSYRPEGSLFGSRENRDYISSKAGLERAMKEGKKIVMRKPDAIRPFQHVLEPLNVYLFVAQKQYEELYNSL